MSTYEQLKGLKVKYLSADTSGDRLVEGELFYNSTDFGLKSHIAVGAWSAGGSLGTGRVFSSRRWYTNSRTCFWRIFQHYQLQIQLPLKNITVHGWTAGGNLTAVKRNLGGAGTQTAGLGFWWTWSRCRYCIYGGYGGACLDSWRKHGNCKTSFRQELEYKLQALGIGGYVTGTGCFINTSEEYDGSSWTAGGNLTAATEML